MHLDLCIYHDHRGMLLTIALGARKRVVTHESGPADGIKYIFYSSPLSLLLFLCDLSF